MPKNNKSIEDCFDRLKKVIDSNITNKDTTEYHKAMLHLINCKELFKNLE